MYLRCKLNLINIKICLQNIRFYISDTVKINLEKVYKNILKYVLNMKGDII